MPEFVQQRVDLVKSQQRRLRLGRTCEVHYDNDLGHALHGMFAEGSYASLSGTNVYRDFVELPSQLMENWLTEKEFLDQIAITTKPGKKSRKN